MSYASALVTGATSGIGEAFARLLPTSTNLLLTGRDKAALQRLAKELGRPGRTINTVPADLTVPADRSRLITRAEALGIDLLINNAGVGYLGGVLDQTVEANLETVELNVVGVADLTRRLLPGMIERARDSGWRAGLIIMSSAAAFAPVPYFATYAASKAFSLSFAEGLADELRGEPVDVLAVCPGPVRTRFGVRAGYSGNLPGAISAAAVADRSLQALGRRTVLVPGLAGRAVADPLLLPRRVLTGGLGQIMRLVGRGPNSH